MVMSSKRLFASMMVSAAIVLGAATAYAQQGQSQPGMMGQSSMGQGMMGQGMMMTGPMLEGRLAYIKADLAITDAQSPAWNAYADAVKARASGMQGMHGSMMQGMQAGSATARMDAHVKAMEAMTEALKALKPATEALYAVLTPEQKPKADQLLGMGCMMM